MIEVESLRKLFRGGRGLDGFSLHLESNELVGLVGPNGAGKTTLIKILYHRSCRRTLRVSSRRRADVQTDPRGVPPSVGFPRTMLACSYQDMRIREFLEFFADAFRLKEPNRSAAIERALTRSGLADRPQDFVEHLSLGWKQRLLLAKTLLHDPKVLLLDEPATGLDPLAPVTLREQLKQLHNEGVAILISSHILSDLEDICTRIVFIADGKNIAEAGAGAAEGSAAPTIRCEVEFEGPADAVHPLLKDAPGVRVLEKSDRLLILELQGGTKEASALLQKLLAAGALIRHFDARGLNLEDRYRRAFGGQTR